MMDAEGDLDLHKPQSLIAPTGCGRPQAAESIGQASCCHLGVLGHVGSRQPWGWPRDFPAGLFTLPLALLMRMCAKRGVSGRVGTLLSCGHRGLPHPF